MKRPVYTCDVLTIGDVCYGKNTLGPPARGPHTHFVLALIWRGLLILREDLEPPLHLGNFDWPNFNWPLLGEGVK